MKQLLYIAVSAVLLLSCGRKSFEDQMIEQAADFTQKQCPKDMDSYTTIDSMKFNKDTRTIHYFYTLKGQLDDTITLTSGVKEDFRENMLVKLRDDLSLKKQKEEKLIFAYHYMSQKSGKTLLEVSFTPEDYTGKISLHSFNYRETRNMKEFTRLQCPMRQDSCTVLDSMWYDSIARVLYYDYSVNGILDEDTLYTDPAIKTMLKQQLVTSIKTNEDIATERDKEKITFAFRYFSARNKKKLLGIIIKHSDLK